MNSLILILLVSLLEHIYCQETTQIFQCRFKCRECDYVLKKCLSCESNYIYNEEVQSCQSNCGYGRYMQVDLGLCTSSCVYPYVRDEITLQCKLVEQCPYLEEIGQQYFDQFTVTQLVGDQIVTAGRNSILPDHTIKIFDSSNAQLLGQMNGHLYEILAIRKYKSERKDFQGIVSVSSKEIVIWNLFYGEQYRSITFDYPYLLSNKYPDLIYIDSQFIVLNYGDERQFGLFYYQGYLDSLKTNPNTKPSYFYRLFEKKHINIIKGFFRYGDYLISYSQSGIYQWNIATQIGNKKCSFEERIKGIKLLQNGIFLIYFFESTKIYIMTTNANICGQISEDDIIQEIEELQVYTSSIFFIRTNEELMVFQLNVIQQSSNILEIPRVDLLQIKKIEESLMMISFLSEGYLVSLEPTGLITIYQIQIDQDSIDQDKVLNKLSFYDFKFQAPMFITSIVINTKTQMISLFGKSILSVSFNFQKDIQINKQQTQKNIPKIQNGHTDNINGMLIDSKQKRIISYSDDGSFKVWELNGDSFNEAYAKQISYDSNFNNANFVMEQYHPSCNPYNLLICKFKVLGMDIFKEGQYLLSHYDDNTVVMWQYSIYQIKYFRTFSLKDQTKKLNNFHIDKYYLFLTISNSQEVRVFNLLNQTQTYSLPYDNPLYTYVLRDDYQFFIVIFKQTSTLVSALFYQVRDSVLQKISFEISFTGQMQSIHITEQDEFSSYANFYCFFLSTNQNKLFFIDYDFYRYSTTIPVATALAYFTNLDIVICFSKTFQTFLVDASYNSVLSQFQYFNSLISENAVTIPFKQPVCFVYINNANDAIKNQVIGINHKGEIIYLVTFDQKITSVKADHVTQKIFIGFQNGQIYFGSFSNSLTVNLYKTTELSDLRYTRSIRGFISFQSVTYSSSFKLSYKNYYFKNQNVIIYDLFSKYTFTFTKKHSKDLSGYILDETNNSVITYSNESNTNLYKWDMQPLEYNQIKTPTQILKGPTVGVDSVFLDLKNGYLIAYSQTLLEIAVWNYPQLYYQFKGTILQEIQSNLTNSSDNQQPQYTYSVKQFYLNIKNQKLLILDNLDQIIAYDYKNNSSYIFTEIGADKFFFDDEVPYLFIKKGFGLQQVLKVFNSSLIEIAEKRDHGLDIINIIFKGKYTYSYDINFICIIDRYSLQTLRTIKSLSPAILNLIISEKLDMIFIWNDYSKDKVLYQKISIFKISTGLFYKEVSANQQLEYGNIGVVTLDEYSYTLFFSRSNFCIFAFDLLRFVYTGYYIIKFNTAISQLIFLPEYNSLVCSDSAQIMYFNVENALNSRNLVRPLYSSRNDKYYLNQQLEKTYFLDYSNSLWVFDNKKFDLSFLRQLSNVSTVKLWNENIFLTTTSSIIKLDLEFNIISQLDVQLRTLYFSKKYIFGQDQNYTLVKIDIDSLTIDSKFQISKFSLILKQLIIMEQLNELIIVNQADDDYASITRYNYADYIIVQTFFDYSFIFMLYQPDKSMLIMFKQYTNVMDIYSAIKQGVKSNKDPNQSIKTSFSFSYVYCVYKAIYDPQTDKLYALSQNNLIIVYGFTFNNTGGINSITIQNWIPLPTILFDVKLKLEDTFLLIEMSWQLYYYDRQTNQLQKQIRDNYVINNLNGIRQVPEISNSNESYFFISSHNSLSLVQYANKNVQILKQFPLSNPMVIGYSVNKVQGSNQIIVQGLSNGLVYRYDFQVGSKSSSADYFECQYDIGEFNKFYQLNKYLHNIERSLKITDAQIFQTHIIGTPQLSFYYDPIITNLKAQFSAIEHNLNSDQKWHLQILDNFFEPEIFKQINMQNYVFDIKMANNVQFSKQTQKIILSQINFENNGENFQMNFTEVNKIILEDIIVQNITLKQKSSFFYFNQCKYIFIKNLKFQNITLQHLSKLIEIEKVQDMYFENLIFENIKIDQSFLLESLFLIQNSKKVQLMNVQISDIQSEVFIYFLQGFGIANLEIRHLNFQKSNQVSFLQVTNSYQDNSKQFIQKEDHYLLQNITINDVQNILNSAISLTGHTFILESIQIFSVICQNCFGSAIFIYKTKQIEIKNSLFKFNQAHIGGAIYILNNYYNFSRIFDCIFKNNQAINSGGALFLEHSNLQVFNTTIQENSALIGGGVRYIGIQPDFINVILFKKGVKRITQNTDEKNIENIINSNSATIHSNNYGSYSYSLKVFSENFVKNGQEEKFLAFEKDTIQVIDVARISNFQSGGNLNVNFQIIDVEGQPIYFDRQSLENESYPKDIVDEILNFKIMTTITTDNIKVYGQYISDQQQFNPKNKTFSIKDMNIVSIPEKESYFYFEVPSVQRAQNDDNNQYCFQPERFGVLINIEFRPCAMGEIYTKSGSLFLCQECKEGFYSLAQPDKCNEIKQFESQQNIYKKKAISADEQQCERCPENAEKCYKNQIVVKKGYWRISNETKVILECKNNQENCNGNEKTGYCKEGHIGPLCEQCDSTGYVWGSRFMSDGKYNCISCLGLQNDVKFLLPSIFVGVLMIIYILFSVKIALNISQNIIIGYYLRKLNMLNISKSAYQDTTNMNMKAMMNYIQISQLINTFEVDLPSFLKVLPQYIGSPVSNFMYTLDCFLSTLQSKTFFLIFLRTIWGLLIPVLYILCAGLMYFILYKFKVISYNKTYLICGLVFIIFFLQPNIINNLLSVLSCRKIDEHLYILADVQYRCYTKEHIQFIVTVCIPGLVLWGLILPLSILKLLFKYRNKLDYATIRLPYGFLYQDYTQQRFYWEFIKSYMKILIVVILNFYGEPFSNSFQKVQIFQQIFIILDNKLVIIMILLLLYQVSLSIMKPYQMKYFQQLEKKSMVTLTVITIMNVFLYNQPDIIQQQIFYLIVLGIHNIYLCYLIFEVIKAKLFIAQKENLEKLKKKLAQYFPFLSNFLKFEEPKNLKIFHNWNRVRKEILRVKKISQIKKESPQQNSQYQQDPLPVNVLSPLYQSINALYGSQNSNQKMKTLFQLFLNQQILMQKRLQDLQAKFYIPLIHV